MEQVKHEHDGPIVKRKLCVSIEAVDTLFRTMDCPGLGHKRDTRLITTGNKKEHRSQRNNTIPQTRAVIVSQVLLPALM